jgi:hypothetical protein
MQRQKRQKRQVLSKKEMKRASSAHEKAYHVSQAVSMQRQKRPPPVDDDENAQDVRQASNVIKVISDPKPLDILCERGGKVRTSVMRSSTVCCEGPSPQLTNFAAFTNPHHHPICTSPTYTRGITCTEVWGGRWCPSLKKVTPWTRGAGVGERVVRRGGEGLSPSVIGLTSIPFARTSHIPPPPPPSIPLPMQVYPSGRPPFRPFLGRLQIPRGWKAA